MTPPTPIAHPYTRTAMNLPQQTRLQQQLPLVRALYARQQIDPSQLDALQPQIEHFEIRLPFIGAFSSGKSSLINALIGTKLLSVSIDPETAIAAELRWAPERQIVGRLESGAALALTEAELQAKEYAPLLPKGWIEIGLPSPALAALPHVVLVDLPGLDSGIEAHQCVIDHYAQRSVAYAVVVQVEEGGLRASLRRALSELAVLDKPVLLVLSMSDKRNADDVAQISALLLEQTTQLMGRPPLALAVTSALKGQTQALSAALGQLNAQVEQVFEQHSVRPWCGELQRAQQLLQLLANTEFQEAGLISAEIETFEQTMGEFDQRLERETQTLQDQLGQILVTIRLRAENALLQRLDSLAYSAQAGADISDEVLGAVRLVLAQAIKEDFEPALSRYLERLHDALPTRLEIKLQLPNAEGAGADRSSYSGLGLMLAPVLTLLSQFPNPLVKLVAVLLPVLATLFERKAERQMQEIEEVRQFERVKSQLRSQLAQAVNQIEAQLRPQLQQQIDQVHAALARKFALERRDIDRTLAAKRDALQAGLEQAAAQRTQASADLALLEQCLAELQTPGPHTPAPQTPAPHTAPAA